MKFQSFLLRSFLDPSDNYIQVIDVPVGSICLDKTYVTHEGIYVCFAVPEMAVEGQTDRFTFQIVLSGQSIPTGAKFIGVEDVIVEDEQYQGMQKQVIFPIFQIL